MISASALYWAVAARGGGGKILVQPVDGSGKVRPDVPMLTGHRAQVQDTAFSPHNDSLLASTSRDATVMVWSIPEGGVQESIEEPSAVLKGHDKDTMLLKWHPCANQTLASTSRDNTVRLWDVAKLTDAVTITGHSKPIANLCWSEDGKLLLTSSKDKKIRLWDPRADAKKAQQTFTAHEGAKTVNMCWMDGKNRFVTTGFTRMSGREFKVWDLGKGLDAPVIHQELDSAAGVMMPFYDEASCILYVAAKGDASIRYWEIPKSKPYEIARMSMGDAAKGIAQVPRRAVDVGKTEIARFIKLENKKVRSISFQVPRKSESFQSDLYPDCVSAAPALTADQWFGGKDAKPKRASMKPAEGADGGAATGGAGAGSSSGFVVDESAKKAAAEREQAKAAKAADPAAGAASGAGAGGDDALKAAQAEIARLKAENDELKGKLAAETAALRAAKEALEAEVQTLRKAADEAGKAADAGESKPEE